MVAALPLMAPESTRAVTVEPVPVPALNPTLYGVVFVQVTETVDVAVCTVFRLDSDPKLIGVALTEQPAVMISVTVNVAVAVPVL
ncbi:hypothetical protein AT302_18850 [Pandoraea norimbergensis]|uniref:Secreted protein n=1 Tax=Pandoraea norimbergensis TaxID=93219 RepID=A0ABN4JMC8_9BURK|nr:hypothetical protein AT302_18850 [Pandoraea norimbergensis]